MTNPFIVIGILASSVGFFLFLMGLGILGHDLKLQIVCGLIGSIVIVMGLLLIQLMKDDSLYIKQPNEKEDSQ